MNDRLKTMKNGGTKNEAIIGVSGKGMSFWNKHRIIQDIQEAITGTSKRRILGENMKEESSKVNNTRMNPDWARGVSEIRTREEAEVCIRSLLSANRVFLQK
jgi:hypothetical protein